MSDVFSRIYSLLRNKETNTLEDYLTEIFSGVFESKTILQSFANTFLARNVSNVELTELSSQKTYPKLDGHDTDSRPDLVVCFKTNNQEHVIFFENKLGSQEGSLQLKRYAEHLESYRNKGFITHLVYLTQFYDPKDEKEILPTGTTTKFYQLRWYQIYNWLQENRNEYIEKVLQFMGELRLNESRKFNPLDMYAIQNLQRIIAMLDECLDGKVDDTMTALFGKATGWTNRFVQLKSNFRYMKYNDQGNYSAVGIGFYLSDDDYPYVSIMFEVNPNNPKRPQFISAMREFLEEYPHWKSEDLNDSMAWSNICMDRKLLEFLSEEDHIESIQNFFVERLKELHTLKQKHPEFEWK